MAFWDGFYSVVGSYQVGQAAGVLVITALGLAIAVGTIEGVLWVVTRLKQRNIL